MIKIYLYNQDERSTKPAQFAFDHSFKFYDTKDNSVAYSNALKEHWGKDDILIMETDMIPTEQQLKEIEECESLACTCLYHGLWEGKVYNLAGRYININGKLENYRIDMLPYSVDYSDFSGTGFCKISRIAQKFIPFEEIEGHWSGIDTRISNALFKNNIHWHLHKTFVKHNHFQDHLKD